MKQIIAISVATLALCASLSIVYYNYVYNHSKLRYEIQYVEVPLSKTYRRRIAAYFCKEAPNSIRKSPACGTAQRLI